jgi:uncharacterized protein
MTPAIKGTGLGLRRELMPTLKIYKGNDIQFFEVAPENWIDAGGRYQRDLRHFSEQYPLVCHGLSLSIGSADPLDFDLLAKIKRFMREHGIQQYTEHLSWCSYNGHLYDLLPIPSNDESVRWVAGRVKQVQDFLEMPIGLENASYYFTPPGSTMAEHDFVDAVIKESGAYLHLDVNNIFVNSKNFGFDALEYLAALPLEKTGYIHVAGHYLGEDGIIIDTHGASVVDPVWALLQTALERIGPQSVNIPICLERDFNFPEWSSLLTEVQTIGRLQQSNQRFHSQSTAQRA